MKPDLKGKKIVFIGPETFDYEKEICAGLERAGAEVTYRSDKPGKSVLLKTLLRLYPGCVFLYADRVFARWLANHGPRECDIVFIIKGEGLSPRFLDILKSRYRNATFVLYLWDSIKNIRGIGEKLSKFDHVFSFDPADCRNRPDFRYRPLFFLDRYRNSNSQNEEKSNLCFFLGTLNGDRASVISKITRSLPDGVLFDYWLFVRSKWELLLRQPFDASLRTLERVRLLEAPMSSTAIAGHFKKSAAVVDIEHPDQVGLTMRTFEVLAAGKKLITTNRSIQEHDFYEATRIRVINRNNPEIDVQFVFGETAPLPESFFNRYSLNGWLGEVFSFNCKTKETER